MIPLTRHNLLFADPNGAWVKHSDAVEAIAEIARERDELVALLRNARQYVKIAGSEYEVHQIDAILAKLEQ